MSNCTQLMMKRNRYKKNRKSFLGVVLPIIAMMIGCGGQEFGQDALFGTDQDALTVQNPCEESMLTWPTNLDSTQKKCSGSWRYKLYPKCIVKDPPNCGQKYCDKYEICKIASTTAKSQNSKHTFTVPAIKECDPEPPPCNPYQQEIPEELQGMDLTEIDPVLLGCPKETCWFVPDYTTAKSKCNTMGNSEINNIPKQLNYTDHIIKRENFRLTSSVTLQSGSSNNSRFDCHLTIKYDEKKLIRDPSCNCLSWKNHPACPVKRHASCLVNDNYDVLYTGLNLSQDDMNSSGNDHKSEGFHDLVCTSGEHMPTGTTTQVQSKYDFLMDQLADLSQPGSSKNEIIKNIKLLVEYHGHDLNSTQRDEFRSYRADWQEIVPGCGVKPSGSYGIDDCLSGTLLKNRKAQLSTCERFTSEHVAPLSLHWMAGFCLNNLTLPIPDECKESYISSLTVIVDSLLDNQFSKTEIDAGTGSANYVEEALNLLDKWFIKMKTLLGDDNQLYDRLTEQINLFWKRIYDNAQNIGIELDQLDNPENKSIFDSLREEAEPLLEKGLLADRKVLLAAFSENKPLTRAPLLLITSDALKGMYDKLIDAGFIHDFACRFLNCDFNDNPSELLELWQILGSLHDKALLDQVALFNSGKQTQLRSEYQDVFKTMYDRHSLLQDSLQDAEDKAIDMQDLLEEGVGIFAKDFKSIVSNANQRINNVIQTGNLEGIGHKDLHAGIRADTKEYLTSELGKQIENLQAAINDYRNNRQEAMADLIVAMRGEDEQTSLENRFKITLEQYNQLTGELDGLRKLEAWDEVRFGHQAFNFEKQIHDLIQSGAGNVNEQIRITTDTLSLDAADTRYEHGNSSQNSIDDVAVLHNGAVWKIDALPGDQLTFQVEGNWAPSCAVATTSLIGSEGKSYTPVIPDPVTGPEGYYYSWQGGQYRTASSSASYDTYNRESTSMSMCFVDNLTPTYMGIGGGLTFSACKVKEWGKSTTNSQNFSTRNESGISTSFNAGIRVEETPFSFAPAGSLLMVVVEKSSELGEIIRDVRVVTRRASFLFDDYREVYLVVNNKLGCPQVDMQNALAVQVAHTRNLGGLAVQLAQAMTEVAGELKGNLMEMLSFNSGVMPTQTLSFLKSWAYDRLPLAIRNDVNQFPIILTNIFDTWVERQIAGIERKVQMIEIKHRMDIFALEMESINADIAGAGNRSRMQRLQAHLGLRNLSGRYIRQDLRHLTKLINKYVYPVLDLRYKNALNNFLYDPGNNTLIELNKLRQIDFSNPLDLAAEKMHDIAKTLLGSIKDAEFGVRSYPVYIALSFPNPNFTGLPGESDIRESPLANNVWRQIYDRQLASITVNPEDLYDPTHGQMILLCDESAPVVLASAVMAVSPEMDNPIGNFFRISGQIGMQQNFPGPDGPNYYSIANPAWISWDVRVMGLDWENMYDAFISDEVYRGFGNGLSPFATYNMKFNALEEADLNMIEALVMMFKVDVRPGLGNLNWLPACSS